MGKFGRDAIQILQKGVICGAKFEQFEVEESLLSFSTASLCVLRELEAN